MFQSAVHLRFHITEAKLVANNIMAPFRMVSYKFLELQLIHLQKLSYSK